MGRLATTQVSFPSARLSRSTRDSRLLCCSHSESGSIPGIDAFHDPKTAKIDTILTGRQIECERCVFLSFSVGLRVAVCGAAQKLAYGDLLAALQLQTVRDLEDFVIDAVYSGLIVGKLDQMGQVFTVSWVTARDVRREDIDAVLDKLARWRERCTTTKSILQKSSR